ncbi:hypothetical protein Leryth_013371 [Lithospermum erythrorhizon]|nr:hypothetical protein Leryth_013371 [Lithospermum erythrorhizon]
MPGIRAPSDYSEEPPRHPCLKINAKEPFNAEPPRSNLISSYVTPVDLFYKRNHGPIPVVEDIESYSVSVTALQGNTRALFIKDIRKLQKHTVVAYITGVISEDIHFHGYPERGEADDFFLIF